MPYQWLMIEHSRLHAVEAWPESPSRQATLAAIRFSIERLALAANVSLVSLDCVECRNRHRRPAVVELSAEANLPSVVNRAA